MITAAEEEETQKRGLVGVYYHMGPLGHSPDPAGIIEGASASAWLPIRHCALHLCTNRFITPVLLRGAMLAMSAKEVSSATDCRDLLQRVLKNNHS